MPASPARLSREGRAARAAVTLAAATLLTAGTLVGDDDAWPFGPFRMYSTSSQPSGVVSAVRIESRTADGGWTPAPLDPDNVGMNRAEVEGQVGRIERDPGMLGRLAAAHGRLRPREQPWVGMRLVRVQTVLADRRPTGEVRETVIAQWRA